MNKLVILAFLINFLDLNLYVSCIQIDNRLVSAQHDCFERIALGAMLPFEKAFRLSDTNSLQVCENLCLNDKQCQTFAFGISSRGNGTCQLSDKVVDNANNRPVGTIFDPDFDLYARKSSNCFVSPNVNKVHRPGSLTSDTGNYPQRPSTQPGTFPPTEITRPVTPNFIPPSSTIGTYPTDGSDGTTGTVDFSTTPYGSSFPDPSSARPSSSPEDLYTIKNRHPTTLPTTSNVPSSNYPSSNIPSTPGQPSYGQKPVDHYPTQPHFRPKPEHCKKCQEVQPQPQGPPEIDRNRDRDKDRYPYPVQGPESYPDYNHPPPPPPQGYPPMINYPFMYGPGYSSEREYEMYAQNGPFIPQPIPAPHPDDYGLPPGHPSLFAGRYPEPDLNAIQPSGGYGGFNNNRYPDMNVGGQYPGANQPGSQYPNENQYPSNRPGTQYPNENQYPSNRPGNQPNGNQPAAPGYNVIEETPDTSMAKPCFRRVLAGKRVAPHWVRRTLICERLEDCQHECGEEKRFSCEGFNYRLDPTGRGQGACELIEVPLNQMDLYSSPNNRDANLIRHQDYDYYERDRSSNGCRQTSPCIDCGSNLRPTTYRPPIANKPSYNYENTAVDKYRPPQIYEPRPDYDRYGGSMFQIGVGSIDGYRPPKYPEYHRPLPPPSYPAYPIDRYDLEEGGDFYKPGPPPPNRPGSGPSYIDGPEYEFRPPPQKPYIDRPQGPPIDYGSRPERPPQIDYANRPDNYIPSKPEYPSPIKPGYGPEKPGYLPEKPGYGPEKPGYLPEKPDYPISKPDNYIPSQPELPSPIKPHLPPPSPPHQSGYLDRDPPPGYPQGLPPNKPGNFVPYQISSPSWGVYGGTYGASYGYGDIGGVYGQSGSQGMMYRPQTDYWGLKNDVNRKDGPAYIESGGYGNDNNLYTMHGHQSYGTPYRHRINYNNQWTRRPGVEECSVKSSEGFRLHKGVVRNSYSVPNVQECEKMCYSEPKFRCSTFSFRYSSPQRDNCLLCERTFNLLDNYADLEPDLNYDIYSMSDDLNVCKKDPTQISSQSQGHSQSLAPRPAAGANDQCFIRTIDGQRFYKSIVRDSLSVRSITECEIECVKMTKFTCRSFTFRYGSKHSSGTIIDNCQLSDWPVRDMDKDRHLIPDKSFDIFERASYGHGCEIGPPPDDEKNTKLCYLGYGSSAKLLSSAIKKVISVPSESDCKNECIRYRETTQFKCLSFSFGSQASTFNCEMSDLDQSELKVGLHFAHTPDRDYWLFAWNPFDYTCRDKITSISTISGNRQNSDRRMDIFKEPGGANQWRYFTTSGQACRVGTKCEKNMITGFFSCEIEGGEVGSWDYCCRTPCGYSRDFDYPWCYVGQGLDQWRTCSDKYYPPMEQMGSQSSHTNLLTRYSIKKGDFYQAPPRPGGLKYRDDLGRSRPARLQYLYENSPPNSTIISNVIDCMKDNC